jgi:hypothetical protein
MDLAIWALPVHSSLPAWKPKSLEIILWRLAQIAWLLLTICSDTSFQLATYHELLLHKDLQMDFACSSSVSTLWSVKTYLGDYQLKVRLCQCGVLSCAIAAGDF